MRNTSLHERLITHACTNHGWTRTEKDDWRLAFGAACHEQDEWIGEFAPESTMLTAAEAEELGMQEGDVITDESELAEVLREFSYRPDAWRLSRESPDTPGQNWSYPVLVLEFLEVEVTNGIVGNKKQAFINLFWAFDCSSSFYFRVWHMDRFGITRLYLDETTVYRLMGGREDMVPDIDLD